MSYKDDIEVYAEQDHKKICLRTMRIVKDVSINVLYSMYIRTNSFWKNIKFVISFEQTLYKYRNTK